MDKVYVAMFGPLPAQPTGLAMSVLRRAQAFANAGIRTEILIDKFYPDFDMHMLNLRQNGSLGDTIRVRNIYADLSQTYIDPPQINYTSPLGNDGWIYTTDNERAEVSRGRFNGEYLQFVWSRNEGRTVHFIDNLVSEKRVNREWFDSSGRVCKRENMNSENRPVRIDYLDSAGRVYLIEYSDAEAHLPVKWEYLPNSASSRTFDSFEALYRYWLMNFVLDDNEIPTFISEYGFHRESLQHLERSHQATVVYTFHSNHHGGDHSYGSPVRAEQADFIDHLGTYSAAIVLTNEQRLDLWKAYGYNPRIHVIPHHLPPINATGLRDEKKVVMIGRFDKDKGQEDALRAFKAVLNAVPNATLDFYGRGADENRISKLIEEMDLGKSVSLKGFTDDSYAVFSESAVSVVPSKYEGFCLSLAESMAAGCVPVAYDFKYGPRALIRNGVDGIIVELNSVSDLADAIILLLRETSYRESLSKEAQKISERLTEHRLVEDWLTVLKNAQNEPKPESVARRYAELDVIQSLKLAAEVVYTVEAGDVIDTEKFFDIISKISMDDS